MADKKKKQYTNEGMDKSYRRLYSFVKPLFMLLFPFRKIHAREHSRRQGSHLPQPLLRPGSPDGLLRLCPNAALFGSWPSRS